MASGSATVGILIRSTPETRPRAARTRSAASPIAASARPTAATMTAPASVNATLRVVRSLAGRLWFAGISASSASEFALEGASEALAQALEH